MRVLLYISDDKLVAHNLDSDRHLKTIGHYDQHQLGNFVECHEDI
jgi:hypothetical protein